jgi:hypothetical protein
MFLAARAPRTLLLALAALISLLLVVGDGAALATGVSVNRSASGARTASITKVQAVAYARAVNLRAGDVPAMAVTGPGKSEGIRQRRSSGALARCAGIVSQGQQFVDISSPTFIGGRALEQEQISSGVSVLSSAAVAALEFAAIRSARGRACITSFAERELSSESRGLLHYVRLVAAPLRAPLAGIDASFGLRLTVILAAPRGGHRFYLYLDFLGFRDGPAEISLNASGFSHPVSSATERRLLSTLYARARAHKL